MGEADGKIDGDDEAREEGAPPPTLSYSMPGTVSGAGAMKLVTVATFGQSWEAHLACGKLEAAGIPAVLADENIVGTGGGLYTNMTGGIKLQVPAVDVERAVALLPRRVRPVVVKCPKCGGTETRQAEFSPGLKAMFLVLLGIPYLFVERPWVCLGCRLVWKRDLEKEEEEDEDEDEGEEASRGSRSPSS